MARTALPARLAAIGLLAATLAYTGWSITRTVGDPTTSGEIATELLSRPGITDQLLATAAPMLDALQAYGVPAADVTAIGEATAADPRVAAAVAASVSSAHDELVRGEPYVYVYLPGDVLTAAVRDAAAARGLDPAAIPELTGSGIEVPSATQLGIGLRVAQRWSTAAAIAAALIGAAIAIAADRAALVSRVGRRTALASGLMLAGAWLCARLTETAANPIAAAAGIVAAVWRSRTHGALAVIFVVAVIVWVIAEAAMAGKFTGARASLPKRQVRNGDLDSIPVGARVGDPADAGVYTHLEPRTTTTQVHR